MTRYTRKFSWIGWMFALMLVLSGGITFAQDTAAPPTFSHSTDVTNRYCPRSQIAHLIALGEEQGGSLRVEETLLPMTRTIEYGGGTIEAIVSYYVAYGDGQLIETAFDYYAQDDAGNVYYLGEDVTNYDEGQVLNHEGTWLVGREGAPAALFLPAHPTIGMMWNPENRPGLVLETDEVLSLTEEVMTPRGLVMDGMRIQETLMDGTVEFKTWAVNFCDVLIDASDEQARTVWVNYTTDEERGLPDSLISIEESAEAIFDHAATTNWADITQNTEALNASWEQYLAQDVEALVPQAFQDAMSVAVDELQRASADQDAAMTRYAANQVSFAVVDLFTYYNPALPTDLARMDALERQVLLNLEANDLTMATNTLAQSSAIWVRLRSLILAQGGANVAVQFETSLNAQIAAVANSSVDGLMDEVNNGLEWVDAMEAVF